MTEYLMVAAIALWALLYSIWALMPAGPRRGLAKRIAGWARQAGLEEEHAQGLQSTLAKSGRCDACSSCPGCGKPGKSLADRESR